MTEYAPAKPKADVEPVGFGGWLLLPIVGTAITLVWMAKEVIEIFFVVFRSQFSRASPIIQTLVAFEAIAAIGLFLGWIFTAYQLYHKKRAFPTAFIAMCVTTLVVNFLDVIVGSALLNRELGFPEYAALLRPTLACAIWTPYMRQSRRVKITFIN